MPSNHLILSRPLLLPPSIFPSIRVFSNVSVLHIRRPKYWSFSFSISPSNEYSGLISFRMDWLDVLVVQGTLKSLLQHYSSKASILWCSALLISQLSHPYMTTGKTIALTRWTFVGRVTSLLFNMLSRLVVTFLPRSKCILISWLQSPSAVTSEPKKVKFLTASIVSPSICHEVMGPDTMNLAFPVGLSYRERENLLEELGVVWIVHILPKFTYEILAPEVDGSNRWGLWELFRSWRWNSYEWNLCSCESYSPSPFHHVKTQQEGTSLRQEEGPRLIILTPDLGLPDFQNCKNHISVVYKPPSVWYFIIAPRTRLQRWTEVLPPCMPLWRAKDLEL